MKSKLPVIVMIAVSLAVVGGMAVAAQDRFTLTVPNGLGFAEFRGYETWQDVAVSATDNGIRAILANPTMINAYREGVPGDGKPFPDGSMIAKIEWTQRKNPQSPNSVTVPGTLKSVSLIEKDSKRFPQTHGWAFAPFSYDAASNAFKPSVTGTECGYTCHTRVAAKHYIFTAYPPR